MTTIQNYYNITHDLQEIAEELGLTNAGYGDVAEVQEPCEADDIATGFDSVYEGR